MLEVIKTYGKHVDGVSLATLHNVSLREVARIVGPIDFEGRALYFLDMSSGSTTGTFKDWLACVSVAHALDNGLSEIVTQTSGNTGNSLARYCQAHGIRLTVFYPAASRYKIDPEVAGLDHCRFVELDLPEPDIKEFTHRYSQSNAVPWYPLFAHQIQANKLRAFYLEDWSREHGIQFDWHVQALSSGYGILGYRQGLTELGHPGIPVLGAQQSAVAPFCKDRPAGEETVLEPTLFRSAPPQDLIAQVRAACQRISIVDHADYHAYREEAARLLASSGVPLGLSMIISDFSEKAPLLATIAALAQIRRNEIATGQNVLIAVTGGAGRLPRTPFQPSQKITLKSELPLGGLRERFWGPAVVG